MVKTRVVLYKILQCLADGQRMTITELSHATGHSRKVIWQNVNLAEVEGFVERQQVGEYELTEIGRRVLEISKGAPAMPSILYDLHLAAISPCVQPPDLPTAKCEIISPSAKAIEKNDLRIDLDDWINSEDTGAAGNLTRISFTLARAMDEILDAKGRSVGIEGTQTLDNRDTILADAPDSWPGYDLLKRKKVLASSDIMVIIRYEGKRWAQNQDFDMLEREYEESVAELQASMAKHLEEMPAKEKGETAAKMVYSALTVNDNDIARLRSKQRLFAKEEDVRDAANRIFNRICPDGQEKKSKRRNKALMDAEGKKIITYQPVTFWFAHVDKERLERNL